MAVTIEEYRENPPQSDALYRTHKYPLFAIPLLVFNAFLA